MSPSLTRHAAIRSQQRGIPPRAIEALLDFGTEYHDHQGAVVLMLDRAATKRLARAANVRGAELDSLRGLYAVLATDGCVRTVGHRTRRLQRH
ncbi:MAG: DUF4258 domain-containing protein [Burkholderiales bacterium]